MAGLKHIHSYVRCPNRKNFYKCDDPYCTHFVPRDLILGKACHCACGAEFVLTREDLRRARPRCPNCSDTKVGREYRAAQATGAATRNQVDSPPHSLPNPAFKRSRVRLTDRDNAVRALVGIGMVQADAEAQIDKAKTFAAQRPKGQKPE
jgi:hypothetical protein